MRDEADDDDDDDADAAAFAEDADDELDKPKRRQRKAKPKPSVLSDPQHKKGLENLQVRVSYVSTQRRTNEDAGLRAEAPVPSMQRRLYG